MTTRRAVTYGCLACLLAAWLASAASTPFQAPPREPERISAASSTDALAAEVQAHTARLRRRLASAPTPQAPHRNPFVFAERQPIAPPPIARRVQPAGIPEPEAPSEPALSLIGIAEDRGAAGLTRTAIIADESDAVLIVTVGQTVLGRYRVQAIGADAVELQDLGTNATRRLGLR